MIPSPDHLAKLFTYAFQPIVDVENNQTYSYEALLRGVNNESAQTIFAQVPKEQLELFNQMGRNKALELAATLKLNCHINLNFSPTSLENSDQYVVATIDALEKNSLLLNQLIIEITEEEIIHDPVAFSAHINKFKSRGIKIAIDDFGAGYSGLNLLANFQPDLIKLDMQLIRNIESHGPRQAIVTAIIQVCESLGVDVIAEGVETLNEYRWLHSKGINLYQGYLFAKPEVEELPNFKLPQY